MSILPSRNQTSSSSTSSSPQQQTLSNHGFGCSNYDDYNNSLQIYSSNGNFSAAGAGGPVASSAAHFHHDSASGSSKEVINTPSEGNQSGLQHQVAESAEIVQSAPQNRRAGGSTVSSPITVDHHSTSWAGSSTHSAAATARKTQMVSGNHLLNFHYQDHHVSRPYPRPKAPPPRRQQRRKSYNKDLFLQANYKFVLLDTVNYATDSMDPDKMLQWDDIICVNYLTSFQVHCPICLEDPLCPQITSCGHIFCFPCVMQYLMLGEDDHKSEYNKKCPLCFTMISSKDLYTIYIQNVKQHLVGDILELMLLTRKKDSFVLALKNNQGLDTNDQVQVQDPFSKFTFTSDVDLSVREAISNLNSWVTRADSGLVDDLKKLPYVCAAIEQLEQRKKYWNERRVSNGHKALDNAKVSNIDQDAREFTKVSSPNSAGDKSVWSEKLTPDNSIGWAQTMDTAESFDDHERVSSSFGECKDLHAGFSGHTNGKDRDSYNFYQAVDGQHLILHPLNMKCLLHHYGCYNKLPDRISGKILQLESVTQSEATRRRYRYLSHFSLTTTFQFCEIDLSEALPLNALSPFMDEIKNREKERKRLARKEHREKIKAEAAGLGVMLIPVNYEQTYYDEPPTFSMDDFEALGSSVATSSSPPDIGERQSFSNVARLGFAAGYDSPALRTEEAHSLPKLDASRESFGATGPRNDSSLSFANVTSRGKTPERPDAPKTNDMGKKGKKQNRVLLSTAGGRRY